jgi:hypothetical protein
MVKYKIGSVVIERIDCQLVLLPTKICVLKLLQECLLSTIRTNYVSTGNYCLQNRSVSWGPLLMMQHNIGHLCDNWPTSNYGIISEHDVLPLRLITLGACETNKTCKYCCRTSGIRENLTQLIQNAWKIFLLDMSDCGEITTITKTIELSILKWRNNLQLNLHGWI